MSAIIDSIGIRIKHKH